MKIFLSTLFLHIFIYAAEPPFKTGEILKYTADWNGIKVGEAELFISGIEKINGFESYKISFTTKTKGLASRIFPIKDRVDVWIDKKNYFTHRLKKNINQANYKDKIDVIFNYNKVLSTANFQPLNKLFLTDLSNLDEKILSFFHLI